MKLQIVKSVILDKSLGLAIPSRWYKMPMVQLGHFSPDAPAVDVMVDGDMAFEGISFRETTELAELDEGSHEVEVRPHGEDASVITEEIRLEDGMHYTVIAAGILEENDISLEIIAHPE